MVARHMTQGSARPGSARSAGRPGRPGIFWVQLRRAARARTTRYALLAMLCLVAVSFVQTLLTFWGHDVGELPSAAVGWAGNAGPLRVTTWAVLVLFLIFLIPSSAFADSLYLDVRHRAVASVLARTTTARYVASTAAAAALAAFVVVLVPLLLSQALALLAFPVSAPDGFSTSLNDAASLPDLFSHELSHLGEDPLGFLRYAHPYLYNLAFVGYDALWAALAAMASVAVSLWVRRGRLVVLGVPTLVYLASSFVLPREFVLLSYLYPSGEATSPLFMVASPLVALAAIVLALAAGVARGRDVAL